MAILAEGKQKGKKSTVDGPGSMDQKQKKSTVDGPWSTDVSKAKKVHRQLQLGLWHFC
jgi:hypothetical protein